MKEIDALKERLQQQSDENAQLRASANTAQLMEKFKINVDFQKGKGTWRAWHQETAAYGESEHLNTAVVQCVAKLRMAQ